jgi:hypothetical protein
LATRLQHAFSVFATLGSNSARGTAKVGGLTIGRNNMRASISDKDKTLTIVIDLETDPKLTDKGNLVVASSHGNQPTGLNVNGSPLIVGLNAYVRKGA